MPSAIVPLIIIHVSAVLAKLSVFFAIPRLRTVEQVKLFLKKYRPFERSADWILWLTGAGLVYFASWQMMKQAWMIASIILYIIVFVLIRFALTKEMEKISDSKKLLAEAELKKLRVSNWCIGIIAVVFLGIIAYLMMTKP